MFYEIQVKDHIRVPPSSFGEKLKDAVLTQLNEKFNTFISKEMGLAITVSEVLKIGEGVIIPGDGAAYYETEFKLITFKPELQEVIFGRITDITDFGAFINIGAIDGMIHISQTMDDYVSFSKSGVLSGKETGKSLKVNDSCKARIIAISYKEIENPKIGLTMRQPWIGKVEDLQKEKDKLKESLKPKEEKKKK